MNFLEVSDKKQYLDLLLLADEQENMIDKYIYDSTMYVLDDGGIKGEIVVLEADERVLEIKNLAVVPECQGQGYGRKLIEYVCEKYKSLYSTLQVGTGDSPLTIPFYEKCGFAKSHTIKNFFVENYDHPIYENGIRLVDMIVLRKELRQTETQNKMGTMGEGKLLLAMGLPLMLSMFVQALYNIVDSYFVAQIPGMGDTAVNALTLAFPVQMLMIAFNVGTGVGVGAVLSRYLGQNEMEKAKRTAGNAMFLYACYFAGFLLFGIFFVRPYISGQTSDKTVAEFGTTYLRIITCFSFGCMGEKCFEKLLQSTGRTLFSMAGQLTGSVTNIALDPIFIFGYFGVPAMGVKGAAVATVIGQFCAVCVTGAIYFCKAKELRGGVKYLKVDGEVMGKILKVGAPAILMQALTSIMTYGMNLILKGVSASAVTAFGVYYKLQSFVFMPAFGLNNALVPIIGFNYGKKEFTRVKKTIKFALLYVAAIMIFGIVLFETLAAPIAGIFNLSENVTALCALALRIVSAGFLFAGASIILQAVCQALGSGMRSLLISLFRLVIVVLPLGAILSRFHDAQNFIWFVFPIAESVALFVAIVLTLILYRKILIGGNYGST